MQRLARTIGLAARVFTGILIMVGASSAQTVKTAGVGAAPASVISGQATRTTDLAAATPMQLTIVVMPKRDALAAYADEVNDPKSPNFHRFLTLPQLKSRFMPSDADVAAVEAWAKGGGLMEVERFGSNHAIVVRGTVGQVNALLNVKLGKYALNGSAYFANDKAPTVPAALAPKIADILGLNSIQRFHALAASPQKPAPALDTPTVTTGAFTRITRTSGAANPRAAHGVLAGDVRPQISGPLGITNLMEPQDLWAEQVYNFNGLARFSQCCNPAHLTTGSPAATSIAIIGSDKPDLNDVAAFFRTFNIPWDVTLHETGSPACCDDEMTADPEWAAAAANSTASTGTGKIFLYAGDGNISGLLHAWEAALSDNKTRVASTSYADAEPDFGGVSNPSMSDFTDVTRSMTAMGWTLVASAGDEGGDAECVRGSVYYPATDPNVVAVGGTSLLLTYGPLGYQKETAWGGNACANPDKPTNNGGGGGGCSDTFPATAWNPKACTNGRRAIPDFSLNGGGMLQALYYSYANCVYTDPVTKKSFKNICGRNGTSIAAPEVAGFFVQENAYLLTLGNNCGPSHDAPCAPLGRAGPILFAAPKQPHDPFYDITTGNTSNGLSAGFKAVPGYDLATGLGSANMMQLAWAINYNLLSAGSTPPIVAYSGAQPGTLYPGAVTVNFAIKAANRGVAGYSASNFTDPGDPASEPTPKTPSSGPNPFWDGPSVVRQSSGSVQIPYEAGCHTVYVRAWDNLGVGNGNANASFGPICMGPANQACHLAVGGCLPGGYQAFSVTCPQTEDFSVDGTFVSASTVYNGQEQKAHQYTYVNACLPGTPNCQGFNTSETEVCPIGGGGGGGGGGGLTCTSCGGNKCCPNPDGGKGIVCVSKSLPCPVLR